MTILDRIADLRRQRVAETRARRPLESLQAEVRGLAPARDPLARLRQWPADRRAVIAEIKRRSPSKGPLRPDLDPAELARAYAAAGAFAISVLTETDHFGGGLADLEAARRAVQVPLLRKDFVVDPYQLWEARAAGADLVLLIVGLLGSETADYVHRCDEVGLTPLVEVHDEAQFEIALASGARLMGVNNRNLETFEVDLAVSRRVLARVPRGVAVVSESGLRTPGDLDALEAHGARAFLIGESLVTAPDPGGALKEFVQR